MIIIEIKGYSKIKAEHLVLDFNGTLAIDGKLIDGTKQLLELLSKHLTIHILTADTFNSSAKELSEINSKVKVLEQEFQDIQKEEYVLEIGEKTVVAIGNGLNDALMLKSAALGIAVIQKEGASAKTILNADIICQNIIDALELLINPVRICATLRK
jgi:P-type E1-E2 ATPase